LLVDGQAPITVLLQQLKEGDQGALDHLIPVVYTELRRLADAYFRRERSEHTLQPTALIHEAYIRLVGQGQPDYRNRSHFYGVAAQIMRQILVDHARSRNAEKRGGGARKMPLNEALEYGEDDAGEMLALEQALASLERKDPRKARMVELRFFAGLTVEEIAELSTLSAPSVYRELRLAQAWLHRELSSAG
jgi:RNA polymerase sigma factor (TIGR02999 family)